MCRALRFITARLLGAPPAASAQRRPELSASQPCAFRAFCPRSGPEQEQVPEHKEIMARHAIGRNGGVNVNEGVVLHDPVRSVSLGLDWVVADPYEDIVGDFEADVHLCPTGWVGEAGRVHPRSNTIVGIYDMISGDFDVGCGTTEFSDRRIDLRPVSGKCCKPAVPEPDILNLNELRIPNHHAVEPQLNVLGARAAPFDDGPSVHLAAKIIKDVSVPGCWHVNFRERAKVESL